MLGRTTMPEEEEKQHAQQQPDDLLTVEEVAATLRMTPQKAARLLRSRQFPTVKVGRARLVRRAVLQIFIDDHQQP